MNGFSESNHGNTGMGKATQGPAPLSPQPPLKAEFSLVIRGCLCFFNDANPHLEGNHLLGNEAATSPEGTEWGGPH